jgi:hypothetical protein
VSKEFDLSGFTPHLTSLQEVINRKKPSDVDMIWNLMALFMYGKSQAPEILELYKAFPLPDFAKFLHIVGGKEIRFPTVDRIEENLISALLYVEREVYKLDWPQLKAKYPQLMVSSLKYTMRIKAMNDFLQRQLANVSVDREEVSIIEEVFLDDDECRMEVFQNDRKESNERRDRGVCDHAEGSRTGGDSGREQEDQQP